MASMLAEKMRRAREFSQEFGGMRLKLRRPTRVEYGRMVRENAPFIAFAQEFVIGWEGVKESDLIASGGDMDVPFDREVWHEVIADRSDLWEPIASAISEAFRKHLDDSEDRAKN